MSKFTLSDVVFTLGLRWIPQDDEFFFKVELPSAEAAVTKRNILSIVARLFDPLGWLSPVIIKPKILIHPLWLRKVSWDQEFDDETTCSWRKYYEQLQDLEKIRIPRWLEITSTSRWELHVFCDASERAYATTLYLVSRGDKQSFTSHLIAARSKVAPIKTISIPKLELCGALLATRLLRSYTKKLSTQPVEIRLWTDSTVVLGWIQGHPSQWKTFVANRVSEIISCYPSTHWGHVRTADNPADCATRGLTPEELASHNLWWHGPDWLPD